MNDGAGHGGGEPAARLGHHGHSGGLGPDHAGRARAGGDRHAPALTGLAKERLRQQRPQLLAALTGQSTPAQQERLGAPLAHVECLDRTIAAVDAQIATRLAPSQAEAARLQSITGIAQRITEVILAELGADMTVFPSDRHRAFWAAPCPGRDESAGTRRSGNTRKGSPWLRAALIKAPCATSHTRSYLGAQ
jgi:transposase